MIYNNSTLLSLSLLLMSSCVTSEQLTDSKSLNAKPTTVPFEFMPGDTAIVVPVTFNGSETVNLVLDTGAGIEVISSRLATKLGIQTQATYKGRRLTNEEMTVSVGKTRSISFGPISQSNWEVAPLEYFDEMADKHHISGLLSLKLFSESPITIDYPKRVIIFETSETLREREKSGQSVSISFENEIPPSLTANLDFLVNGKVQPAIIDTGSAPTKLPMKHFKELGFKRDDPSIRRKKIRTIAGFDTEAFFVSIPGQITLKDAPTLRNGMKLVRFDESLRMGSIGGDFFLDKVVTFDLKNKRIIIAVH